MDAKKACRVQLPFQIGDRLIDAVLAPVHNGIGKFVAGDEMRDGLRVEKRDAIANAGSVWL